MPDDELMHHGIDGQRWGVTHGPPYPLSRSEHRKVVRSAKATKKRNVSYDKSLKYAKRMNDEDLNATIDRLRREETYRNLVSKDKQESDIAKKAKKLDKQVSDSNKNDQKKDKWLSKAIKDTTTNSIKTAGRDLTKYLSNSAAKAMAADKIAKEKAARDEKDKWNADNEAARAANEKYWENVFSYQTKAGSGVGRKEKVKKAAIAGGLIAGASLPLLLSNVSPDTPISEIKDYIPLSAPNIAGYLNG